MQRDPGDTRTTIERDLDRRRYDLMGRRFWLTEEAEALLNPPRLVEASPHTRRVFDRVLARYSARLAADGVRG